MSLKTIKQAVADKKILCPSCKQPIQQFEKYVEVADSVWDGAGDTHVESTASKVTLICGNGNCNWRERTEFWSSYIE